MDFTQITSALGALVILAGVLTTYFERRSRQQRRRNRELEEQVQRFRALVQEFDLHLYEIERRGFTSRGIRPPARPPMLKVLIADEPDEEEPRPDGEPSAALEGTGDGHEDRRSTGRRPRHGAD